MLFNTLALLLDHTGTSLKESKPNPDTDAEDPVITEEVTLGYALENVLVNGGAQEADGDLKFKQFLLAQKIHNATDLVDLSVEEIARIKVLAGPMFTAVGLGAIFVALDHPTTAAAQLAAPPANSDSDVSGLVPHLPAPPAPPVPVAVPITDGPPIDTQ